MRGEQSERLNKFDWRRIDAGTRAMRHQRTIMGRRCVCLIGGQVIASDVSLCCFSQVKYSDFSKVQQVGKYCSRVGAITLSVGENSETRRVLES